MTDAAHFMAAPDELGHFGLFGGRFVPEALMPACLELEAAFLEAWSDQSFIDEYELVLREFAGRPTPVTPLPRLSASLGVRVFAKREDLAHTGSHKINNVIGQTLLTKRMGKHRVIAETGAGQHGVATATAAARFGLSCTVFMGEVDTARQVLNVFRMELLGASVVPVTSGSKTLKDAVNEAMREWVSCVDDTHYCIGSVMGPHPFPLMVREFQSIIGREAAVQLDELGVGTPDLVVACVGGGSNAAGVFAGFANTRARLVGVEAAGGSAVGKGSPGVLQDVYKRQPTDIIEYQQLIDGEVVALVVRREGEPLDRKVTVHKQVGQPLGLSIDSAVFDRIRTCDNHCSFCFIYQLPKGMRRSLYVKDDDFRLSFLYGNYTTLTRFTEFDLERVLDEGLSPLYVSVHSTNPELRAEMLRCV